MKRFSIMVCVLTAVLAGCGSNPGDAEVKEALYKQIEGIVGKEGAKGQKAELDAIKVVGCKKADSNGFVCDWAGPSGGGSGRIVKGESGWVLVALGGQ